MVRPDEMVAVAESDKQETDRNMEEMWRVGGVEYGVEGGKGRPRGIGCGLGYGAALTCPLAFPFVTECKNFRLFWIDATRRGP